MSIFYRIAQQICYNLLQMDIVTFEYARNSFIGNNSKIKTFVRRLEAYHIVNIIDKLCRLVFHVARSDFSRFNSCDVKNIVDYTQQRVSRVFGFGSVLENFLILAFPQNHLVHTDNSVDGCPYFMGHMRKKT